MTVNDAVLFPVKDSELRDMGYLPKLPKAVHESKPSTPITEEERLNMTDKEIDDENERWRDCK